MMQEELFSLFLCPSKIGDHFAAINNTVQKAEDQIVRLIMHY